MYYMINALLESLIKYIGKYEVQTILGSLGFLSSSSNQHSLLQSSKLHMFQTMACHYLICSLENCKQTLAIAIITQKSKCQFVTFEKAEVIYSRYTHLLGEL